MGNLTDDVFCSQGAALGGKGEVGVGEGREFRRQYIFAAATVMSNGKKTPGAMIKYGFPDASWVEGRRLHKAVATLSQTWVEVRLFLFPYGQLE